MQMPCTGIAEIEPWTFCFFRGSDSKKIADFSKFTWRENKKFRDSALIGPKDAKAMHRHSRDRTLDILSSQGVRQQKNRLLLQIFWREKKNFAIARYSAQNMQMPCTGIAEIESWTFCVLRESDTKKIADFCKFIWRENKKFRDSALIGPKYAKAMHRHSRNRTLDFLRSQSVRQQKNRRFLQILLARK